MCAISNFIGDFYKTEHFLKRQWDRNINDKLLAEILKNVGTNNTNLLLIVSRKVLKKINKNLKQELFIKMDKKTLITCFYCEFQLYSSSNREQNYVIIDKLN